MRKSVQYCQLKMSNDHRACIEIKPELPIKKDITYK